VQFRDITPLLANPRVFRVLIDQFVHRYFDVRPSAIAGLDARGFIIGSVLAYELNVGFVPIRKKGKLPFSTVARKPTSWNTARPTVEMHTDAVRAGDRVVLIDDLIATGGTMMAGKRLLERLGATGHRRRGHRRPARARRTTSLTPPARGRAAAVHAGRLRRALSRVTRWPPASPASPRPPAGAAAARSAGSVPPPVRAQPLGQRRQVPELAQVDALLEQAMLVQGQRGAAALGFAGGRVGLDRIVVGDQHRQAAVGDPLQQLRIAAVEHGTGAAPGAGASGWPCMSISACAKPVCRHTMSPLSTVMPSAARMAISRSWPITVRPLPQWALQVDHHAAALHATLGHSLSDAEQRLKISPSRSSTR
jgi:adenine phosphoribosyltransferase